MSGPTVGTSKRNGAAMLVVEAGKTLLIDRDQMIQAADRVGMVVMGRP